MNYDVINESPGEFLSPTGSKIKDINKLIYDYQTTADEGVAKIFKATIGQDG